MSSHPRRSVHYLKSDPTRSPLRDPITGKVRPGPGRPRGSQNVLSRLAKHGIQKVFDDLGGAQGMYDWCRSDIKNLTMFYGQIYPKLLSAQSLDAAADKLSQRPQLTKIESVIIDPRQDYRSTMIEGEAEVVIERTRVVEDGVIMDSNGSPLTQAQISADLERVREEINKLSATPSPVEEARMISNSVSNSLYDDDDVF